VRAYLEKASQELGRSLSQTAELAIERGRVFGELGFGGPAVADALREMIVAAAAVNDTWGAPTESHRAREELRRSWADIAENAIPAMNERRNAELSARASMAAFNFMLEDVWAKVHGRGDWAAFAAALHPLVWGEGKDRRNAKWAEIGSSDWSRLIGDLRDALKEIVEERTSAPEAAQAVGALIVLADAVTAALTVVEP
jgi:hypothetical protein